MDQVYYNDIYAGMLQLKNFAMFHKNGQLHLTPSYDQVGAYMYEYRSMALHMSKMQNMPLGSIKASNIIQLGKDFRQSDRAIKMAVDELEHNLDNAKSAITNGKFGNDDLKQTLIEMVTKRWNGTFALIGKKLSNKQKKYASNKT